MLPPTLPDNLTVLDRILGWATTHADRPALVFVADTGERECWLSYGELGRRCIRLGEELTKRGLGGERALLLFHPGLDFVVAFLGCLHAGVIAVPVYPPHRTRGRERLRSVAADATPFVVLATAELLPRLQALSRDLPELAGLGWLAVDELTQGTPAALAPPAHREALAFLQYTSGSTAEPKGVAVSHQNLLANEEAIRTAFGQSETSVVVGWLPPYHDMGLIGNLLQPLFVGGRSVILPPAAFLREPACWLDAISRHRGTTSGGPNFAFDLCTRKVDPKAVPGLDLRSWVVAFNGAEPIAAETLARFTERFAPCGFSPSAWAPAYGLAEATLLVTTAERRREPTVLGLDATRLAAGEVALTPTSAPRRKQAVACGTPPAGVEVAIVDPATCLPVPAGRIGEIWVAGPSVATGYWGQAATSAAVFAARRGDELAGRWLRTGDLGFVHGAELFVSGRRKELLILRGRNHYPQDLEATARRAHPALLAGQGAATAIDANDEGQAREGLLVVHEVERRPGTPGATGEEIAEAIRRAIADEHEVAVDAVVLLRLGTLPRTSSGKVQRHLCSQFLTGESREVLVRSWRTGSALTEPTVTEPTRTDPEPQPEAAWPAAGAGQPAALPAVLAAAARVSGRPAQDLRGDLPLSDLALDSLAKVELLGALERGLGVGAAGAISLEEIYKAETLDDLARTLAAHLEVGRAKASSVSDGYAATPTAGTDGWLPSAGQRALWLTQKLAPASVAYNLTIAAHIEGPLDADALVTAWRQLVGRHPALRATFAQDAQGRLIARAAQSESSESAQLHREQLASPAELAARQAAISRAPFDLAAGPLVRAYLLAVGSSHLLLLSLHHVVADLWSLTLLARELAALYHEAAGGPSAGLAPPATVPPQPAAAADAERHWPAWQRLLAGMPTLLALPTDRPRATPTSEVAGRVVHLWPLALLGRLEQLAGSVAASLFTVLGAGYAALLSRWTAEGRLVVGSPAAGRLSSGAQAALDYRVNLLPLPFTVPAADSFRQLLESSRAVVDVALAHQELPFPTLVERLVPARDPDRHPVFQVVLSHQGGQRAGGPSLAGFALGIPGSRLALGPAVLCSCDVEPGATPFELALATGQVEGGLGLTLTYRRELFDPTTAGRVLGWLRHLLTAAAADPELPLAALPLLAPAETQQVCREWGDRDGGPAELATLDRQFASAADAYPDSVALVGPEEQVSYRELSRRSRRLAGSLVAHGVGPETRVGLAVGRSSNLVVGILGILGAGGAYVPLDPSYPRERLVAMLARSRPRVVVREEGSAETLLPVLAALGVAELELVGQALPGPAPEVPAPALTGDCAAYLLFTSGSTGEPKGVVITHRAVARLFRAAARWFSLGPEEVWSLAHAYAFDFSVWEMWGALAHGGRVVLLSDEERRSSQQLAERLIDARVSCLSQTPSAFRSLSRYLTPGAAPALRCVVFGGEALSPAAITPWLQAPDGPRLVNMYGITETTVHVTYRELRSADVAPGGSPIGAPLPDLAARVLDRRGQPVGIGIAGELYVAGPGLARGYLDRPAWTAARFVPDAWSAAPGERLYRSGDLVRRLTSSELDYIGRIDAQVQVRGYRVEPAEVETTLQAHPQVLRALVDLEAGGRSSGERLVAWVEVSGEPPRTSEWRAWLGERLPAHAVPSLFVPLTTWPLTPTGKIDRRALPRPAGNGEPLPRPTAGGGSEEQVVRAIWAEVLGRQSVGRDDNFFDLGGHSLLLTEVHGRLERQLGRQVPLLELFRHPTVASLARFLAGDQPTPSAAPAASPRPALEGEIAVVGLAGRFPGAESPAALWELLSSGRSGTVDLEDAELLAAGVAPELLADPAYVRVAAPLAGSDRFDAGFFGYGAREAELLDPQQRVFLECAWEALEDAGHGEPHREAGKVGVFAGAGFSRYLLDLAGDPALVAALGDFPLLVANDKDFLASRVAYKLGLQGPAISVQTACSTSLVAVHLACQSLRDGECDLALAGGVSLADPERAGYLYQQGGILSPDGRCRPFDAAAAGTLRGSGAGVVVLRRLADALADGDAIRAVIKGSAINNDGAEKVGYTAPAIAGQAAVLRAALARAGVAAESVGYIEAHGTGTALGDPIEVAALDLAYGGRSGPPRALGSLKSNLGHLDAAAGVAGLIKVVLALEAGQVPPTLHFSRLNPAIELTGETFRIPTSLEAWPAGEGPRRAAVSSFGIGGTNAHAVLEQAPPAGETQPGRPWRLLPLSARSPAALEQVAARLAAHLERRPDLSIDDLAFTLQQGRRAFDHRSFVVCAEPASAVASLGAPGLARRRVKAGEPPPVYFLFPGQGSQHPGMAGEIYRTEPLFRAGLDEALDLMGSELAGRLRPLLLADPGTEREARAVELRDTRLAQPALFACEHALARLWMSWGVQPAAMLGHSVGEYVAASLAGVLPFADALALVVARAELMAAAPAGRMLAVELAEDELSGLLAPSLDLAAVNAPRLVVAAGSEAASAALAAELAGRGIEHRFLHTSHAFHSRLLDAVVEPFVRRVAACRLAPPQLPVVSNLTGSWLTQEEATDPAYWGRHLRSTVRFAAGLATLGDAGEGVLLEVGPGQALSRLARRQGERSHGRVVASLPAAASEEPAARHLVEAAGRLWLHGSELDWSAFQGTARRRVALPTYPFERSRFRLKPAPRAAPEVPARLPLERWFHVPSFQPAPPLLPPVEARRDILLLADRGGVGAALAHHLAAAGHRVTSAHTGASDDPDALAIDGTSRTGFASLFSRLAALGRDPDLVVSTAALDLATSPGHGGDLAASFWQPLFLLQAAPPSRDRRLVLVTAGALAMGPGEVPLPAAAAALAFPRVAALELPAWKCRLVDLAASALHRPGLIDDLIVEMLQEEAPAAVAWRAGRRWVEGLAPSSLPAAPTRFREEGGYLLTGGLGGMGLTFARALASRYRARVALVARTPLPARPAWEGVIAADPGSPLARQLATLLAIEGEGGRVLTLAADVADAEQLAQAVATARQQLGRLDGVVHAAGVPGGGLLTARSAAQASVVLAPKVAGTVALAQALDGEKLDFVLLCSSLTASLGGVGQLDYCAANLFLEAFAETASASGSTPWIAAGWDGWRDLGMLASADLPAEVRQLRAAELARGLTADEGVAALERLITHGGPRVVLSVSDLTARREAIQALSLASFLSSDNALAASHARPDLDSPFVAARTPVEQALVALWSELLGVEGIGVEDDFFALGGHSLLATRLLTRVRERFGVALALQALIESPTVAALAARLAGGQVSDQVSGQASPEPELTALVPQPDDLHEPFPLTAIQRAYWIGRGEAFELGNVSAHVYLELAAERLPLATLTHAWRRLIARHPMLRAIVLPDGRQQVLARVPSYTIRTVDLRGLPEPEREARLAHFRAERSHHMLASERWPLFEIRACLLPVGYRLQVSIDFLLIDEWSMQVLLRELASLVVEPARKLPPLGLSFRDYVLAERELHAGQRHARDLAYWQERCKELPPPPDLPLAKDPSEVRAPRFVRHQAWLPGDVWGQLKRRAAELAITPSGLLLAAFAEALAGWCRSRRFLLNLTLFNRLPFHPQVGELVGDFTHLSLLAVEWERGDSFGDRARRLQARLWQDLEHRTASGEQALRQRGAEDRRRALAPVVFTSTLGLASEVDHAAALSTLGEVVYSVTQTPQVWLDHVVRERAGGLAYNWDVVAELFPTGLIESLFSAYGELLQRLASDGACLAERRLLGLPGPQRASRERVNATAVPRPALLLDQLALRHAPRQPQAPAVLTDRRSLSHSELAAEAAHWERALRRLGAGPETLVAVVMEKGWEQAVAVLAVLGAGAAYLPIDPALPRERLHHLLRVGEARLALTQPQFATALDWPAAVTVLGVVANPGGDDGGPVPAAPARSPADLAYVLFTSGSTGVPKGVMIEHRGAVNTLLDLERRFAIGPDDRVLALSALSFDLSVYDLFGLPAAGGAVVIPAAGCERDPEHWWEQCERYGVTVWNTVPALMEMLVTDLESRRRRLPAGLRLVLLSGDWIPLGLPDRIRRLRDGVAVISLGGATEASIWSILYPIGEVAPEWKSIPYGRPMENQGFQVVDADGEPCPDWVPGELLISGLGVARGYWRDEARTAASFPRSADGGRLYRTGDLGRYWPDGTLEFLGREDSQVKVRGHRIELGEIEATLASHPAVREAVATAHGPARGDRSLVAYWVPAGGAAASEPELLAFLASRLPEYMLPRRVLPLAQLPLTANGKLDRKALPPPEAPATPGRRGEPPRPGREEDLARLWRELVPGSNPARDDDFFAAGGDSLLATRLVSRLREELRLEVPLRAFFDTPTVAGLAAAVAARASSSGEASDPWAAPIPRVARGTGLAASFSQERLWFLDRLSSGDSSYHIGAVFRLSGRLDVGRLTAALAKVVARHEALRTTLRDDGRRLLQWVAASAACRVPVLDLGGLPLAAQAASAQRASSAAVDRPFDLGRLPLLRCCLLRLGAELHRVVLVIHHSIADGWSMGVLVREISELYRAAAEKRRPDLPPLPIQYADFAAWERRWLASPAAGAELAHWREVLRPPRASLELPSDRPRPAVLSSSGAYRYFVLDAALRRDLEAVAQQHGMTEFMVLLTGFKLLLAAHTGVHDLLVGTPIAHRNRRETEGLVGPFLNTVVLRTDLPRGLSLADALRRVRATAVAAYAHQDLPFEKLVEDLAGERDLARSPLFQVLFQLQEIPLEELVLPGLVCEPEELLQRTAILDLSVGLREAGAQLMGFCRYSTDLFDATTIERLLAHYQRLLRALAAGGLGTVADVDRALLSAAERQQLLSEWQDTAAAVALPPTLSAGLARAERQHAEAIAVCDREEQLSYRELARRAAWLAGELARRGAGRGSIVGIAIDRSVDLEVALVAVLAAGAAYLPLDSELPDERLAFMAQDAQLGVVLSDGRRPLAVPALAALALALPAAGEWPAGEAAPGPAPVGPDDLAYVLYTSGSTGRPKGVMVAHGAIVNRLAWMQAAYPLGPDDVVLQKTPASFDVSVWELFWPLLVGARLVMAEPGGHRDSAYLLDVLAREAITTLHFVPSMLQVFLAQPGLEAVRPQRLFASGEALGSELARRCLALLPESELHNLYGPTEAAVDVSFWAVRAASLGGTVPIGRPISNLCLLLASPHEAASGGPAPLGVAAELLIGGHGLARGYLHRPGLTARCFVPDGLSSQPGARLYRTGDLARWRPDGNLEFLGRLDFQVKVRGLRIELGEIEAALAAQPTVREAVVVARPGAAGDPQLVAYLTADGPAPAPEVLQRGLEARLPAYMVPAFFVILETFPLTPSGKVDRRALPAPAVAAALPSGGRRAPSRPLERRIAEAWREVLGDRELAVDDNFFRLGGNSITAALFINRLQEQLGEILHVVAAFDSPTIAELAAYLERDYPSAVARLLGREPAAEPAVGATRRVSPADRRELASWVATLRPAPCPPPAPRNRPAVFVLSPPRSGSTLLRVLLAGHSHLFAPPELELLTFNDLGSRAAAFTGRNRFWLEGLQRAVMALWEISGEAAAELLTDWEQAGLPTAEMYRLMQARLRGRTLVDKTPSYALDTAVLERAETWFEAPLYLHLRRHPYGMIRSFTEAHLEQVFFRAEHGFDRRSLAELVWTASHSNISDFLAGVPAERQLEVAFEDLVTTPRRELERICAFLGLELEPAMLEPYGKPSARMTDGPHAASRMLGDVKFHQHGRIEPSVAAAWQQESELPPLGAETVQMAARLGYELPDETDDRPRATAASGPQPLSFSQERLWVLDQIEPQNPAYNLPLVLRLRGELRAAALAGALRLVVERQPALRTRFLATADGPRQELVEEAGALPAVVDLSGLPAAEATARGQELAAHEALAPFDLTRAPLLRLRLWRLAETEHWALLTVHHIVTDGWSMTVLLREVSAAYSAIVGGGEPSLPPLALRYLDYALWQRRRLSREALAARLRPWRERLAGLEPLALPTDRPRPTRRSHRGGVVPVRFAASLAERARARAREDGGTLFQVLLTGFATLLSRLAGRGDLTVGTPVANRHLREIEGVIGFFVNTLVLRLDLDGPRSFTAALGRVREATRAAFADPELPFEKLVEELAPERDLAATPLFQVMLALQNAPSEPLALPALAAEVLALRRRAAKFDLSLLLSEGPGGELEGDLEYAADLFDATTATRWVASLERLLTAALADPASQLGRLPLLSPPEAHQLVWEEHAGPRLGEPGNQLHSAFFVQAANGPDRLAVVTAGEALSYGELAARARRQAAELWTRGAGPEATVGVLLPRDAELAVALLGVLAAGAAYVPLDPAYPAERLRFMLDDAAVSSLLSSPALAASRLGELPAELPVGTPVGRGAGSPAEPLPAADEHHLAYLIYTSGSTGRPKGVAIEHASATAMVSWALGAFAPDELARTVAATSTCFDLSVFELFVPWSAGACVLLVPDALALAQEPAAAAATLVNTVPSALGELLRLGPPLANLRGVNLAGEPLPRQLVDRIAAGTRAGWVRNLYGPSEDTTYSTWVNLTPASSPATRPVTIGRPLAGTTGHVLDAGGELAPRGVPGELHLGGAGLARGYFRRPARTAASFVPDRFAAAPGARLYRTGDLVQRLADGELLFLGRLDDQVKVRGYRIELGEIESALRQQPGVREAVVVAPPGATGARELVAYVAAADPPPAVQVLRDALAARLPAFMVPRELVLLAELPRTASGKLDRRRLPAPGPAAGPASGDQPRGVEEELLGGILAEVLGRPQVGRDDDFFALGGYSLLAVRVVARAREVFGCELPVRSLFERPTLAGLAQLLAEQRRGGGTSAAGPAPLLPATQAEEWQPLSFAQERMHFLQSLHPETRAFNMAGLLSLEGHLEVAALTRGLEHAVARQAALRTAFMLRAGELRQRALPPAPLSLPVVELSSLAAAHRGAVGRQLAREAANRPFALASGRLLGATLLRLDEHQHQLALSVHHIAFDGASRAVLLGEVAAAYAAFAAGGAPALPALPISFADYSTWQRNREHDGSFAPALAYWRQALADAPAPLTLPGRRQPNGPPRHLACVHPLALGEALTAGLEALCRDAGVTLFMGLLAGLDTLLSLTTGEVDLVVGANFACRSQTAVEGLVGPLVNTLPLRVDLGGEPTFRELLGRVREATLAAVHHQDLPYELLPAAGSRGERPELPFRVMLAFERTADEAPALPGLRLRFTQLPPQSPTFELLLALHLEDGQITGALIHDQDHYEPAAMARLGERFTALLAALVAAPDAPVSAASWADEQTAAELAASFNFAS